MMQGTFHVAEQQQHSHHQHHQHHQHLEHHQHSASPDPFTRFLDRSSIYYDSLHDPTPTPSSSSPTLRPLDIAGFRTVAHCDWSDSLPFLPGLHYDYPNPSDNLKPIPPPFSMTSPMPGPLQDSYHASSSPSLTGTVVSAATSSDITQSIRNACANNSRGASRTSKHEGTGPRPREKKHGCWMCEKSFDRPSTLRKHLLVHTGEKAFVCDTCGRRFGVASNLNRHVKRCILKPVNVANRATQMPPPSSSSSPSSSDVTSSAHRISVAISDPPSLPPSTTTPPARTSHKRTRDGDAGPNSPPDSPTQSASKQPIKRRRRAPSPSQWVPKSLADFNITPAEYTKSTPVPLPPVTAYKDPASDEWIEERNSWDENVGMLPYHPCGWKGTLPGPAIGLGGKDMMNLGLVNGGTYVMGRLVMV